SSSVNDQGFVSIDCTCDGKSESPAIEWSGAPAGTKSFAISLWHTAPDMEKSYWVVYNIPADILNLEKNSTGIGTLGTNSVNGQTEYAPPCSKGPGEKVYTYTVYALSAEPQISLSASQVSREVLLDAIQNITLASAALNVTYTR
ncbi:MAG TPA: YbhB/YbcL family Raf kinase inhibitor-like protein, partial [Anaerolineales bacterium]|nr:YbhB/YbcL family Raf kinase inhibitor-like protein [Anaerolineales bacterium]